MVALIVHGGAWDIPDDLVEKHRAGCRNALIGGWEILRSDGSAEDAVERAINIMEEDPVFDAGRGSHLNAAGEIELDASIMNGTTFRCGAVAAVQNVLHPISLARKVMDDSEHILLVGKGAQRFALERGMSLCRSDDLLVGRELDRWRELQQRENFSTRDQFRSQASSDTVGAVAIDRNGIIVAGTSTGGTPNKYPGRVGDSPLIGCGCYADSSIGGVSTTGWGEAMIKIVMAKTVIDLMEANGGNPQAAAESGIHILKRKADGDGGVIVLNPAGTLGISYNTPRMARAFLNESMSAPVVEV
jgi:beta-aspartyl-peptidase (threonine type)